MRPLTYFSLALALAASSALAQEPLPSYPGAPLTRIGTVLRLDGQDCQLGYFVAADPLPKVAAYFFSRWKNEGYPSTAEGPFPDEGVVSSFLTREGRQRAVILLTHQGRTLGFSLVRDLWSRPRTLEVPPPALEGALVAALSAARDEGGASAQRAELIRGDAPAVREQLVQTLGGEGYRLKAQSAQGSGRAAVLEFGRGAEGLSCLLAGIDRSLTAVLLTWTGPGGMDGGGR